ncbi:hypothetical protein IE53DRAFT_387820 [Violaceomyces palustris]|uniref:Uncharacterized protein n=1 Tax=Violaceomyces palustris TaxID=1673888 RepID=A0ACD0NVT5_9BASI|nr:hypothetical protein IE53DRAFT_387820 [Violaceomyces palustris]
MSAPNDSPWAADTASSDSSSPSTHSKRSLVNIRKQLKYILIGGSAAWYFQIFAHLSDALSLGLKSSWNARIALMATSLLVTTIAIFAHVITLPSRGYQPDYLRWHSDPHLKSTIPALTICIISGFFTLLITLSPLGAPPPPPVSLAQRLTIAARHTGSSLGSASRGVQQLASEVARALGIRPSTSVATSTFDNPLFSKSAQVTSGDTKTLLELLRLDSFESLASKLGVSGSRSHELQAVLDSLQRRAEDWARGNVRTIGWTGALLGSAGTYLLIFGTVGLLGALAPASSASSSGKKHF